MKFKQPINLNDLEYEIIGLDSVIGIADLKLVQKIGERKLWNYDKDGVADGTAGYGFFYSFEDAVSKNILRPSVTPSVFEIRNPNTDIIGKVS